MSVFFLLFCFTKEGKEEKVKMFIRWSVLVVVLLFFFKVSEKKKCNANKHLGVYF